MNKMLAVFLSLAMLVIGYVCGRLDGYQSGQHEGLCIVLNELARQNNHPVSKMCRGDE